MEQKFFEGAPLSHWHSSMRTLSMDAVDGLLEHMGLTLANDETRLIREYARRALETFHQRGKNYFESDYSKVGEAVAKFLQDIRAQRGDDFAEKIRKWIINRFSFSHKNQAEHDRLALLTTLRIRSKDDALLAGISDASQKIILSLINQQLRSPAYENVLAAIRYQSRTEWDAEIWSSLEQEGLGALDDAIATMDAWAFNRFEENIRRLMPEEEATRFFSVIKTS